MAAQPPDARTLKSWEDAFQYPLPVVRKLEQQLRKNIDDNRQKLRSLVGASYRDLLGTAERIIEMDEQVQTVEMYLGDIGKKCNARTVENITENQTRLRRTKDARGGDRFQVMAQTKVLQSTLSAATRIIRAGEDALQASKLLVLSRLLLKSVSESSQPPPVLTELRQKLNALRSKLLFYIERSMMPQSSGKTQLVHILCAYALVNSSSPKEVLRHFLQVRYDQLDSNIASPSDADILQMLDLYSQTVFDTRELFPRRFAEALSQLSKIPLLQDEHVQSIPELNIDIYRSWIAEDIRTFTPWIRHDQLVGSEVADALAAWTKQGQTCLLGSLRRHLQNQNDPRDILRSRHAFLSKFIGLSGRLKNATSANAIQDLRVAFATRLGELAVQSAQIVDLTLTESDIARLAHPGTNESTLWDLASEHPAINHGAFALRRSILNKRHGRSSRMESQTQKLDEWLSRINSVLDIAEEMTSTKWDDDLDFDLEDLDGGESLHRLLSKDDPNRLREKLREAVRVSFNEVVAAISASAKETKHPFFYLRIWREVDLRRRALEHRLHVPTAGISLVDLHRNIAQTVCHGVVQDYISAAKGRANAATTLWDGSPALPVQPSPMTFRFLVELHKAMSAAGSDLWTAQCVFQLKRIVSGVLVRELEGEDFVDSGKKKSELTNGHQGENGEFSVVNDETTEDEESTAENGKSTIENENEKEKAISKDEESIPENGEAPASAISNAEKKQTTANPSGNSATANPRQLQRLFDLLYLSRVLRVSPAPPEVESEPDSESESLRSVIDAMKTSLALSDASIDRLVKSAGEYWKRTYLLFGLLAPDGAGGGGML